MGFGFDSDKVNTVRTTFTQPRFTRVMPVILATIFAVVLGSVVVVAAPAADATTGRRVCLYAKDITGVSVRTTVGLKDGPNSYSNPRSKRAVGVNYTANKSCPKITDQAQKDRFSSTFQGAPRDQVTAVTCESWLGTIGATGVLYAHSGDRNNFNFPSGQRPKDVCGGMKKDIFYEFDIIIENISDMVPKVNDFTVDGYTTMTIQDLT